jgi:hypothetical protein
MPDPMLQKHYCVAAMQHRVSYNVIMSLPSSQQGCELAAAVAIGPVLAAAGNRARIEWQQRHQERGPKGEEDGDSPWR